jgi:hypothetical protein
VDADVSFTSGTGLALSEEDDVRAFLAASEDAQEDSRDVKEPEP